MSYASQNAHKPPDAKGMTIAIAVHGLIVAIALSLPGITVDVIPEPILIGTNTPIEPDPAPPPPPEVKPEVKAPAPAAPRSPNITEPPAPPDASSFLGNKASGPIAGSVGGGIDIPLEPIMPIAEPTIEPAVLDQRFARNFQPAYPPGLLRLGEEGMVTVRVLVDENGRAREIELIDSPHPEMWTATRKHGLKQWRFRPATRDGVPYESWITLKVRFTIND